MAFPTTSFIPYPTIEDALTNAIALNLGSDSLKCALYYDTATFTDATDPLSYTATGEAAGTGYTAAGQALTTVAFGLVAGTGVDLDADDVSWANTTISTAVMGCMVYDDTLSPKAALAVVYFGNASGYTTNNGTFGITWSTSPSCIWQITLHA